MIAVLSFGKALDLGGLAMDEHMTIPKDLVGAMMQRLHHLEEGIGRIYLTHRKTGCTGCDLCRRLEQVLAGGMAGSGPGEQSPTWIMALAEHKSACGYPDTPCTCFLEPDGLCKCGHPRGFHAQCKKAESEFVWRGRCSVQLNVKAVKAGAEPRPAPVSSSRR
jgi:hypothetical protein